MSIDEGLRQRFLQQLRALEEFRITYAREQPEVVRASLDRADQDIQRLLEAQAFFSARTLRAAETAMTRSTRRLSAQHFPYLFAPIPALVMIEAKTSLSFVDPVALPAGEELELEAAASPPNDAPASLLLRTLAPLTLMPLELVRIHFERSRPRDPVQIQLDFSARYERLFPIGKLALHVDHLGDLAASAAVFFALQSCLQQAVFRWDERGDWESLPIEFGPLKTPGAQTTGLDHPFERVRSFFRLPEQDLYMVLGLPEPPGAWTQLTVRLQLSESWPPNLKMGQDSLRLHVVPAANIERELATPISLDGTQVTHEVMHSDLFQGFVPLSVLAVYRLGTGEGLVPLSGGFVPEDAAPDDEDALRWEAEVSGFGPKRRGRLRMIVPSALEDPIPVSVDALWHQPGRAATVPDHAPAQLLHRAVEGVAFQSRGRIRPALDALLEADDEALLGLLSARSRRDLSLADIEILIKVLTGSPEHAFADIVSALKESKVQQVPSALAAGGFGYRYTLVFEGLTPPAVPRLHLFGRRFHQVVEAWNTHEVVDLEIRAPELDQVFNFGTRGRG